MDSILRNLVFFAVIALATSACGGGGAAISTNSGSGSGIGNPGGTSTGSVTLQWSAPTTWADTTPSSPSDVSGYRIYYGPSATYTPYFIDVNNANAIQDTITLPSGTYYFRISAIDSNGNPGLMSSALQKTL